MFPGLVLSTELSPPDYFVTKSCHGAFYHLKSLKILGLLL